MRKRESLRRQENISIDGIFDLQFAKFRFDRCFVRDTIDPHTGRQFEAVLPFQAMRGANVQWELAGPWSNFGDGHASEK